MVVPPKIHKRLYNVRRRPVISNCGTDTDEASEFFDNHLKPIVLNSWSYITDLIDKRNRIKNMPNYAILVTAYVTGLHPYIPHVARLNTVKNTVISLNFLVWKLCRKTQFLHSFGRDAQNYVETMLFYKISTLEHQAKLRYFCSGSLSKMLYVLGKKNVCPQKTAENSKFYSQKYFFEFNGTVNEQISVTSIRTKCAPSYASIFYEQVGTQFHQESAK